MDFGTRKPGLDVETYFALGPDLRDLVDSWLDEHGMRSKHVHHFVQGEGYVEATRYEWPLRWDETHRAAMFVERIPTSRPCPVVGRFYPEGLMVQCQP